MHRSTFQIGASLPPPALGIALLAGSLLLDAVGAPQPEDGRPPGYPEAVSEIRYPVSADGSEQPALFWAPSTEPGETAPLLVALHTWSGDYRQAGGEVRYAEWCLENDWIFLHPDFRGPNRTPEAMGSDLVVADIRAAVAWARQHAPVDENRIYAVGVSGGGHAAQLVAGRLPEIWAGVTAWCGISDIAAWHAQTRAAGRDQYARDIEKALGGAPGSTPEHRARARRRSPVAWLARASGVPLDLNHGIRDGRAGSVPFTHSLRAWNAVAPEAERLPDAAIEAFYETQNPPSGSGAPAPDPLYGERPPLFRRTHGNTRLTIFDGGHEIIHVAALNWLAAQRRDRPAQWNVPKVSDLETTDADARSGR